MSAAVVPRPDVVENRPGVRARRRHRALWFWIFTGPFFAGLMIFIYIPIVWSIYLSFFDARNTVTPTKFVGLANYTYLLTDPTFLRSLGTFVVFAAFIIPVTWASSLGLALLLNRVRVAKAFFRSVFFLPTACSYVIAAMIWRLSIFNGARFGLINIAIRALGGDDVNWLGGDGYWYWVALVSLRLWLQVGFYMILFVAGLQRIPADTYEAAALDGATGFRVFRFITLPQLRSTSAAVLLLVLIAAFQAFDEFYNSLITVGGYPPYAKPPLVYLYLISLGGNSQDLGLGSAGTIILTIIIAFVGLLQLRFFGLGRKEDRA
ncbi:multiple sugar transport system permease protein [Friedmanniella endophytica]|uniref:Multiple sugar transport system permease protein n=1 Tax=Microlunatus kandeliicorticis TaxID=1759536 RepID=A0A7W3IV65_9ACTN|nr:sugar ABC transporter permease [Microlunatus kandeliicorticis]MBA8795851.1 multiple sugar transport system permease protein [Microlunatus kandeliicorticis]